MSVQAGFRSAVAAALAVLLVGVGFLIGLNVGRNTGTMRQQGQDSGEMRYQESGSLVFDRQTGDLFEAPYGPDKQTWIRIRRMPTGD